MGHPGPALLPVSDGGGVGGRERGGQVATGNRGEPGGTE